jgi:plastocyanin
MMLVNTKQAVTISFAGIPAGTYPFHCAAHGHMHMQGTIVVQ